MAERKIDALTIPKGFAGGGRSHWQHSQVNAEFAKYVGAPKLWFRDQQTFNFAYANRTGRDHSDSQAIYYPDGHPLKGEDRYEWFLAKRMSDGTWKPAGLAEGAADMPHEVKFGYLKEDPYKDDAAVNEAIGEARKRRFAESQEALKMALADPEGRERLKAKLNLSSDEELDELFKHVG